jgi:signal transduction histidine kinase
LAINLSLRWRISGMFGGGAMLLTALLTGLGVTAMAQTQFSSTRTSALESAQGAAQTLAAAVAVHSANLAQVVRSAARAAGGDIYVLEAGRVLGSSGAARPPRVVFSLPTPAYPEVTFDVVRGVWLVVAVAPVEHPSLTAPGPGEVVLVRRLSPLQAELTAIQRSLWLAGAAAALGFAVLGFLFAHSIAAPLERLTRAARRMSAGDLEQRVALEGAGEAATLSRTFNEMAERVATLDRLRRQFVADAAHELRTPVAGMRALAESFTSDEQARLDPEMREGLMGIRRESERLARLIDQLLALARLENPGMTLHRETLRAELAVQEALWSLRAPMERRAVSVRLLAEGEAWISGDPDWIHRAVLNVLDNAVRHAPDGSEVEVTVRRAEDAVEISVADRGSGVPEEELSRLGGRFVRLAGGRARGSGAGLGLALVRDVMARHEGQVAFANRPGGGLVVTLRLPAAASAPETA